MALFRPLIEHHVDDLRDNVTSALDRHRVTDPDVGAAADRVAVVADALDVVVVVQRGVLHHDAADRHRLEFGDRRQCAGAADLDFDVAQHRGGLLGSELVRDRPARAARHKTEPLLPVEPVELIDDAVDVVVELGTPLTDAAVKRQHLIHRADNLGKRVDLETDLAEPFDHAGLRRRGLVGDLAPRVGEEVQRTRRGDARVLLPQRTGRRVARVGEHLLLGRGLALVEREEVGPGHVDFAADLARRGNFALQLVRDLLDGPHIGGDVLAFEAVAARRGDGQLTVLVAQRHRQPVDLRLGHERKRLVFLQVEEAADAVDKVLHLLGVERVLERQHRHRVAHLGEAARGRRADLARQAFQRLQVGKLRLDRLVAPPQRVVFCVGNGRRVLLVVGLVVLLDLGFEARVLALRLARRHFLDGQLGVPGGHAG